MSINYTNLGLDIGKSILSSGERLAAASLVGALTDTPVSYVGYGQKPYIPLTTKISQWNRYILTLTQAMVGIGKLTNNQNLQRIGSSLNTNLDYFLDHLDLPISSRLLMFKPKDPINANWSFPILVLPVNPNTFRVNYRKKSDLVYTLGGFVVTHWHDDVISITGDGYIPSFKNKAKILSDSYQYFLQFLELYLSCGKVKREVNKFIKALSLNSSELLSTQLRDSAIEASSALNTSIIKKDVGKEIQITTQTIQNSLIELRYQQDLYEGIFTSFSIEESYEMPNTLRYNFDFKAMSRKDVVFGSLNETYNAVDELFGTTNQTLQQTLNVDIKGLFTSGGG